MLMVILQHLNVATGSHIFLPFYMGFMGVDVFLIISAYGLCHAFKKYDLKTFYRRRVLRIFPLYVFLAVIVTSVHVILGYNVSVWDWLCNLSTLSYYGIGGFYIEWYLSALLLLYLLFPILYNLISKAGGIIAIAILIVIVLSSLLNISWSHECAIARIPFFLCGILLFFQKQKDTLRFIYIVYGVALLITTLLYLKEYLATYMVAYMTAPFVLFAASWLVQKITLFPSLKIYIEWIGKHSIELYVANICACNIVCAMGTNLLLSTVLYILIQVLFLPFCIFVNNQVQRIEQICDK